MNHDVLDFCRALVQVESLSGKEEGIAQLVKEEMEKLSYDEVYIDPYGSVIGKICGTGATGGTGGPGDIGARSILFDGHMDTVGVPSPEKWRVDPFGGEILDGKLYGRGSADMKGALGAMIYGAADLARGGAANQGGRRPAGDIYVCALVFEETLEGVALGKILDHIHPDAVVLGEPSGLKLALGQKGRAEIVLETYGKNAHSATPHQGVNAIDAMHRLVGRMKGYSPGKSEKLGDGILEITDIASSPYPGSSVVPNYCRLTYDRRLIEDESAEDILKPFQEAIAELKEDEKAFDAGVSIEFASEKAYTGELIEANRFFPGWIIEEDKPLVLSVEAAFKHLGKVCDICYYPFCTDGSESAGKRGIPTVGIGPASPEMAHVVDEYVSVDDILIARDLYREIALAFLG